MNMSSWSQIRANFLAPRLRYAFLPLIVIPPIVHALKSIPQQIVIDLAQTTLTIHTGLPFSWKCIYLASLLFTISAFIYEIRCPPLVKLYNDYDSYLRSGFGLDWLEKQFISLVLETKHSKSGEENLKNFWTALKPHIKGRDAVQALTEMLAYLQRGELIPDTHQASFTHIFRSSSSDEKDLYSSFRALRNLADLSRPRSKQLFLFTTSLAWFTTLYPFLQSVVFVLQYIFD